MNRGLAQLMPALKRALAGGTLLASAYIAVTLGLIAGIAFATVGALSFLIRSFDAVLLVSDDAQAAAPAFDLAKLRAIAPRFRLPLPAESPLPSGAPSAQTPSGAASQLPSSSASPSLSPEA